MDGCGKEGSCFITGYGWLCLKHFNLTRQELELRKKEEAEQKYRGG